MHNNALHPTPESLGGSGAAELHRYGVKMKKVDVTILALILGLTVSPSAAFAAKRADDSSRTRYAIALKSAIMKNWSAPDAARSDYVCTVSVRQNRSGYVREIKILKCPSGIVSNSILQAIVDTSPLPQPDNPDVFENVVQFMFSPGA